MEALPLLLDQVVDPATALLISITAVLFFGEIIPQAICSKFGLQIGATLAPLVQGLLTICAPLAVPVAAVLDHFLGPTHKLLFRRAEFLALLDLEFEEGLLTADERLIMGGAVGLVSLTAEEGMTPFEELFSLSEQAALDQKTVTQIARAGYSRIPVHATGNRTHILGFLVVKHLIVLDPEDATPVRTVPLLPLHTVHIHDSMHMVLNSIQATGVHTAIVVDDQQVAVGFLTISDVMERLLQEEIFDRTSSGDRFPQFIQDTLETRDYNSVLLPEIFDMSEGSQYSSFDGEEVDQSLSDELVKYFDTQSPFAFMFENIKKRKNEEDCEDDEFPEDRCVVKK
eukprot:CAMPEP_0196584078 /NCGR_PEP_ID=MMETSP1081-20130531/45713_1 /TAXON_ID=36882 /ORGANISM="Pyramimonas amylifera, Strain CCMP720" /LENGTH=340 /DNA_ID=CAMNT_0041905167 /DNA_START=564 /DNA_END=1586 /DNA_ORIENTATION=-